jgi:hypothetical protein
LLADFGVARLETEDSLVTRTGALLGTPAYMSPEQASGDTATVRSDLYSLGATLYQLATGSLPYSGTAAKIMSQIASGALVPPVRRRPAVGPDLSRVIEQLMETEAARRPAKAADVATELRGLATAGGLGEAAEELAGYFEAPDAFVRERTPAVVTALVSAGKRAVAEQRLSRAIALADRASELAPEDPAVKTLVETVTQRGRASGRRRALAIAAGGLLVAGGATAAVLGLRGGSDEPARTDAAIAMVAIDAAAADTVVVPADVAVAIVEVADAAVIDAGRHLVAMTPIDAARPHPDARIDAAIPVDAAVPDAAVPVDAAVVEVARISVFNDTWCDVYIDDKSHGRLLRRPIIVPAGHHTVRCEQPGTQRKWSQEVDVAPGESKQVRGSLLVTIDVAIAISHGSEVLIDNVHYPPNAVVKVPAGRREVTIPGVAKAFVTITSTCTIRDLPELGCY